jgi:integrase
MGGRQGVDVRPSSIRVTFSYGGKQHRQTLTLNGAPMAPTPANVRYAERLAAEIRERIRLGTFSMAEYFPAAGDGGTTLTVGTQLDAWMAAQRLTTSTRQSYESIVRFWKLQFGDKALKSLRHSDIMTALASQPTLSGKTINNRVSVLRDACAMAVLDGVLPENPAANIPSAKWQRKPVDPFSLEEVEQILADMRTHYPEPIANYAEAKFFTGMRTGESFALQWQTVDLNAGEMVVAATFTAGEAKDSTKTNVARTVLLNTRAAAAFKRQAAHTYLAGRHVFLDPRDGKPWTGEPKFRFYWLSTLKRLKMRHRPPYNTRHTYATMMLMAGLTPAFCAKQMGHSIELFLTTYSKWIPGAGDRAEMAKLENRLKSA